jgi:hypothetical protein
MQSNSLSKCKSEWREKLKFVTVSAEWLKTKYPSLEKVLEFCLKLVEQIDIPAEPFKNFYTQLKENSTSITELFEKQKAVFTDVYKPYLDGLNDEDIEAVRNKCGTGMFTLTANESNTRVKAKAEEYRQGQIKTKLFSLWQERTDSRTPREWSSKYKLPILCMVSSAEYDMARKTFETLNRSNPTEAEIENALAFLQLAKFFDNLNDDDKRRSAFVKGVIGKYAKVLPDIEKLRNDLDRLSIEPYDWYQHDAVNRRIRELAQAEYNAGGSDVVIRKIDSMDDATAKAYLRKLILDNMTVGLEIIESGEG